MSDDKHLYLILHPNPSLVGSQYSPEQFARHYVAGSTRHYDGKVVFAELDPSFRHPYFPIDEAMTELVRHEDGRPKATKFISVYRVLEHVDIEKINKVYLTSPEAACLELVPDDPDQIQTRAAGVLRIFAEITPVRMLVLSKLNIMEFGDSITDASSTKSVPSLFYTQLEFDTEAFLSDFEVNPLMQPPIPGLHPSKLRDAIVDLKIKHAKISKGLALDSTFNRIPYRLIRHGFMFTTAEGKRRFFRMPKARQIEEANYKFWKSM